MPRGKNLSDVEKGQIQAYHASGKSFLAISRLLNRSRCVIRNFLKNEAEYGQKKRTGRKKKLSERSERLIAREVSNTKRSCNDIKRRLKLDVSKSTILRSINRNPNIVRAKMMKAPSLKDHHKTARLDFARRNMNRDWGLVSSQPKSSM
jgi:IS30 family transposase